MAEISKCNGSTTALTFNASDGTPVTLGGGAAACPIGLSATSQADGSAYFRQLLWDKFKNPYSTAAGSVLGATDLTTAAAATDEVTAVVGAQGYMSLLNSGTTGLILTTNIGNQDGGATYEVLSETMSLTD